MEPIPPNGGSNNLPPPRAQAHIQQQQPPLLAPAACATPQLASDSSRRPPPPYRPGVSPPAPRPPSQLPQQPVAVPNHSHNVMQGRPFPPAAAQASAAAAGLRPPPPPYRPGVAPAAPRALPPQQQSSMPGIPPSLVQGPPLLGFAAAQAPGALRPPPQPNRPGAPPIAPPQQQQQLSATLPYRTAAAAAAAPMTSIPTPQQQQQQPAASDSLAMQPSPPHRPPLTGTAIAARPPDHQQQQRQQQHPPSGNISHDNQVMMQAMQNLLPHEVMSIAQGLLSSGALLGPSLLTVALANDGLPLPFLPHGMDDITTTTNNNNNPLIPPKVPTLPPCWHCKKDMEDGWEKKRGEKLFPRYRCKLFPLCPGQRRTAQPKEAVFLQLRNQDMKELCLSFPDMPEAAVAYGKKWLPARLKKSGLKEAVLDKALEIRRVSPKDRGGGGLWEVVLDVEECENVTQILRTHPSLDLVREVPLSTLRFARLLHDAEAAAAAGEGAAGFYASAGEVERRYALLPRRFATSLFEFQKEGVRFALRRNGRCLIGDEMGTGKTLQALAIMVCYQEEWPLLIVVPASLRLQWAEVVEAWIPFLRPADIHVVFGSNDRIFATSECPPVMISSYEMLRNLEVSMTYVDFNCVIFDESHKIATSRSFASPNLLIAASLRVANLASRVLLLSGTPSLTRPFEIYNQVRLLHADLLGTGKETSKWEYGRNYCTGVQWQVRTSGDPVPKARYDGARCGEELHWLLRNAVMIRRLKKEALAELPPLVRTIVRVEEGKKSKRLAAAQNAVSSTTTTGGGCHDHQEELLQLDEEVRLEEEGGGEEGRVTGSEYHELGKLKLGGAEEWLEDRFMEGWLDAGVEGYEGEATVEADAPKYVIFAHHLDVLASLQATIDEVLRKHKREQGLPFSWSHVNIQGCTQADSRQDIVKRFRADPLCRVALIGITAGGQGLDLAAASTAVFVELPDSAPHWLRQAEDRLHRRGQKEKVQVYYLVLPPGSKEDKIWQKMRRLLRENTAVVNSREKAEELEVARVQELGAAGSQPLDPETVHRLLHEGFVNHHTQAGGGWRWGKSRGGGREEVSGGEESDEEEEGGVYVFPPGLHEDLKKPAAAAATAAAATTAAGDGRRLGWADEQGEKEREIVVTDWSSCASSPVSLREERRRSTDGEDGQQQQQQQQQREVVEVDSVSSCPSSPASSRGGKRLSSGDRQQEEKGQEQQQQPGKDLPAASPSLSAMASSTHGLTASTTTEPPSGTAPPLPPTSLPPPVAELEVLAAGSDGATAAPPFPLPAMDVDAPPAASTAAACAAGGAGVGPPSPPPPPSLSSLPADGGLNDIMDYEKELEAEAGMTQEDEDAEEDEEEGEGGGEDKDEEEDMMLALPDNDDVDDDQTVDETLGEEEGGGAAAAAAAAAAAGDGEVQRLPAVAENDQVLSSSQLQRREQRRMTAFSSPPSSPFKYAQHQQQQHATTDSKGGEDVKEAGVKLEFEGQELLEESDDDTPKPTILRNLWFEVSKHTGWVHLHESEDGTKPLGVHVDPLDYHDLISLAQQALSSVLLLQQIRVRAAAEIILQDLPPHTDVDPCEKWQVLKLLMQFRTASARIRNQVYGYVLQPVEKGLKEWIKSHRPTAHGRKTQGVLPPRVLSLWDPDLGYRRHLTSKELFDPSRHSVLTRHVLVRFGLYKTKSIRQPLDPETHQPMCFCCGRVFAFPGGPKTLQDLLCSADCLSYFACLTGGGFRRQVGRRDRGMCEMCGLDTLRLLERVKGLSCLVAREAAILEEVPKFAERPKLLARLVREPKEGYVWNADHLEMVAEGGGLCDISNGRALCVLCHAVVTAEQSRLGLGRKRSARKKRKEEVRKELEMTQVVEAAVVGEEGEGEGKGKGKKKKEEEVVVVKKKRGRKPKVFLEPEPLKEEGVEEKKDGQVKVEEEEEEGTESDDDCYDDGDYQYVDSEAEVEEEQEQEEEEEGEGKAGRRKRGWGGSGKKKGKAAKKMRDGKKGKDTKKKPRRR